MKKGYSVFMAIIVIFLVGCSNVTNMGVKNSKNQYEENRVSYFEKYGYPKPEMKLGIDLPYLQSNNYTKKINFLKEYSEKNILKFYKDLNIEGYGDNSYYWRWNFSIGEKDYEKGIKKALVTISKYRYDYICILEKGKWVNKSLNYNSLGNLEDIVVMERGKSGVITYLLIKGSKGTFLIKGEYAVRIVLGLNKTNIEKTVKVNLAKGGDGKYSENKKLENPNLLPSGFLAIEKKGDRFNIYGGGYGHGVGMSQYGANDLSKNYGYNYVKILKKYYRGIVLKNMYGLKGVSKYIRVAISTTGFRSLDHGTLTMLSTSEAEVWNSWMKIKLSPRDKIKIVANGKRQILYINGEKRVETAQKLNFKSSNKQFIITSIIRAQKDTKYPIYRGKIETLLSNNSFYKIKVINEVFIEDYLVQVVPSEMPQGFGLEALKAQTVAARTYALSEFLKSKYKNEGFDVRDDTYSQVYNRVDSNVDTIKAIKSTYGKVMLYNGKPIDAKYYSTSSGYGAASKNIW